MRRDLRTIARIHLRDAADNILIANYSNSKAGRELAIEMALDNIVKALLPDAIFRLGGGPEELVEFIATCITDSTDIDCTSESQAMYIVAELFKHIAGDDDRVEYWCDDEKFDTREAADAHSALSGDAVRVVRWVDDA